MNSFTVIFFSFLIAGTLLQWWLSQRQINHVLAHRPRVPPAFQGKIGLQEHQKAGDYTVDRVRLGRIELFYDFILVSAWTLGGGLEGLYQLWQDLGLNPLLSDTGFILSFSLISLLLQLPLSLWRTFHLETEYGFNRMSPRRYLVDLILNGLLIVLIGGLLIYTVLWLMGSTGRYWWVLAWGLWMGFSLLLTWVYPVFIAPLFNRFVPLEDGGLKRRIQDLLGRCGFSSNGIFVMDGSTRSRHGNAYFTGLGKQKRIVFFDTLVEALEDEELEAVLAHELGHFRHRHMRKRLLVTTALSLLALAMLGWLADQTWFYYGLGVDSLSNGILLVLFLLATPVFTIFFTPVESMLMRNQEFEADDFAIKQTGGKTLVQALVKLYKDNASTLTPDPLYSAFHDSHPPAPVRVSNILSRMGS